MTDWIERARDLLGSLSVGHWSDRDERDVDVALRIRDRLYATAPRPEMPTVPEGGD